MKKVLLSVVVIITAGMITMTSAQQTLTLKIIETGKDGETSISFDDGEYENGAIDKLNDDDLDMGWEGDDLNVMTSFTRFQNVTIPQGSVITSAKLQIYAHEDESDEARVTVYAEDIDDSPLFSEDESLEDRTMTETSVDWTITEAWTMWEMYESPDLSAIVQEVVDRAGWEAGNSLTLFMQGEDQGASLLDNARDFESFENIEDPDDGGDGLHHPERVPTLVIEYTPPPGELVLTIIETGKDGETSISFDDGEYENGAIDKLNDDDLDMGWEGDDLNVMTSFTRFQNVTIDQGTQIDSAVLIIYAHEDETDEARVTIFAEDIDDSPMFSEDELLSDRTMTETTIAWTITEAWTMWEPYHSPNLAPVIQEVIDRAGWQSGNSLTLFMQGEDQGASLLDNARDFESFENIEDPDDGGDGLHHPERVPTLKLFWGGTKVKELIAAPDYFRVYPNPAAGGMLNVEPVISNADYAMQILNLNGQVVKDLPVNSQLISVDISDLNAGIYIVRTQQNGITQNRKIILQ